MGSEKFCLKWNDFETNISHAFRELRDDAELFDVTLACCDDDANRKLIQAHKVILSACSPFFRNMLRQNKAGGGLLPGNPLIYLRGVKHSDMEAVLSFMYQGEVNVPQDQLNSFLSVAEDLKVKGLTQNKSNDTKPKSEDSQTPNRRTSDPGGGGGGSAAKKPRLSGHPAAPTVSTADEDDDIQEVVPVVKAEPKEITAVARGGGGAGGGATDGVQSSAAQDIGYENQEEEYPDETYDESYDDYAAQYLDDSGAATGQMSVDNEKGADLSSLMEYVSRSSEREGGGYSCSLCTHSTLHKGNILQHVEAAHFPDMFHHICNFCGKEAKSKGALSKHVYRYHSKSKLTGHMRL